MDAFVPGLQEMLPRASRERDIVSNLSVTETTSLHRLMNNREVTVKRADKGGAIVVMDTTSYIDQMHREHLQDANIYKEVQHSPTRAITRDTNTLIDFLLNRQHIDQMTADFMRPPTKIRTPILYGLPKIHKDDTPLRPVISGIDSPTDNLSKYMTHYLQPLATNLPTYLRDSKHFKQHLNTIPPLTDKDILVTADVKSLYTNIPQNEGIDMISTHIDQHRHSLPTYAPNTHEFKIILHHILTHSHFTFAHKHYIQTFGTSIGCRMAPPYANIYMYTHDQTIINSPYNVSYYKRLIDDIFFIFTGTETELNELIDWTNGLHPTIKYKYVTSRTTIDFLDMKIYVDGDRRLRTTIYRKDSDCSSYLHFHSNHPFHTKCSIIYSHGLRYNLIIDNDDGLQINLNFLTKAFLAKGYPLHLIQEEIKRAMVHTQDSLIYKIKDGEPLLESFANKERIVVPYSEMTMNLQSFLNHHWVNHNIGNSMLRPKEPPKVVFRRHKNLEDILVHTKLDYKSPTMD